MKTLVLDKSALQAAPAEFLKDLRDTYHLMLTTTLLEEVGTEEICERGRMTREEKEELNLGIDRLFDKAIRVAGNSWIDPVCAGKWEMTQGSSARFAPRYAIEHPLRIGKVLSQDTIERCQEFEREMASSGSVTTPPRNKAQDAEFAVFRQKTAQESEESFFCRLARNLASSEVTTRVRETAEQSARKRGEVLSVDFFPRRDWFIYGVAAAHKAYFEWKLWKYGDTAPRKSANFAYDLYYIGFMAIADGLLSSDKAMLKLAWAIWPDKRANIFEYFIEKREVAVFTPQWSPHSGPPCPEDMPTFL